MTDSVAPCRFVVLISGRGSNMQHIVNQAQQGQWPAQFVRVIANERDAPGIAWAQARGIPNTVLEHRSFARREQFDHQLAQVIEQDRPDYVLLAGFMRILSPQFVRKFKNRLVNIHPSLLPAFPGLRTHAQAIAAGVGWHGCTVHFVTDELDHGPIIAQAALAVSADDTAQSLAQRVLQAEHLLYPRVVHWLAQGQVRVDGAGQVALNGVTERHIWIPA
jgi:phosphoribosylglycinamide formyltransferase-1